MAFAGINYLAILIAGVASWGERNAACGHGSAIARSNLT